ncbi:MAG: phage holin [Ruminococcus sp.]|nr:phage holin [Ruminococcus sp.]
MKINWKVRFKNPMFWVGIVVAVVATVSAQLGLTVESIASWSQLWQALYNAVSNPVVVVAVISAVYNAIIDPTTKGVCDSKDALEYDKPKEG